MRTQVLPPLLIVDGGIIGNLLREIIGGDKSIFNDIEYWWGHVTSVHAKYTPLRTKTGQTDGQKTKADRQKERQTDR